MSYIPPHFQTRIKEAQEQGLRELDLSNDWRTNDAIKLTEIPAEVFQLEQLESLNLSVNQLSELPESITKLSNLTQLYLSYNKLSELPESITKLSNLTRLYLSYNLLSELPESITKLSNLTRLDLSINQLSELPESITKLSNLTWLDLSINQLSELPESITKLSNLTQLHLRGNQLSELPESITKLSNLTELDLSENQLSELPESITKLSNLTRLDLSINQLSELPESITKLSNLTWLDLRRNQLSELPESITKLSNLTQLHLRGNQLSELPESITKLSNLTELDLSENQLSELPESITKLSNLTELDLSENQLSELPESIGKLSNLTELDLNINQLSELTESITKLSNLTELHLSINQLSELPKSITKLSNLTQLDLSVNQLSELPESITKLSNLTWLDLSENQLSELPESITKLSNLTWLHLSKNQLSELPESMTKLSNLTQLDLDENQLSELPESITKLSNLTWLDLSENQLSELPKSITKPSNLTELNLSRNQLSELPESITKLSNLTELDLSENQLSELPESITKLSNLTQLNLRGNPLKYPPLEIAAQGIKAIEKYFQQFQQGKDYLYEAKLLIVGEAGAGKTTLAKKIQNPEYQLQEEDSTQGIDVITFNFPLPNQRNFRINIWDFGGQEIYHATHQFFLTKRSLYALVVDTRKEDTDFYYWLNIVQLLSDNSPLLIIKNEKQDRAREINELGLRGEFSNLEKTLATNLKTKRGLAKIIREIQHYISNNLPHVGDVLPKTWKQVREVLEQDPRDYISLDEYFRICQENQIRERQYQLQLSGYLHDLGVCLHFQDDPLLKKTVILKPEWGTAAVYKVLDNDQVWQNFGKFTKQDLVHIWQEQQYQDSQDELLQLMIQFQLCYQIPNQNSYIAPQLLTEKQPTYDWNETDNLILRYTYEFMPKGILSQFIVVMNRYIRQEKYLWKSGVILEKDGTKAEIIEYYGKREIKIRVTGQQKRDLLITVTYELDKIHASYPRLKYNKLIPCNCNRCKEDTDPYFYPYNQLRERITNKKQTIECGKPPYDNVNVFSLIDDTMDWRQLEDETKETDPEKEFFKELLRRQASQSINFQNIQANKTVTGDGNMEFKNNTIRDVEGSFIQGDYSGNVASLIAQLPDSHSSQEPGIKELLSQLQEAINSSPELQEENKVQVLEQVETLAEAGANPHSGALKKAAKTATLALKGIAASLPEATKFVETCGKILPSLTQIFS